MKNIIKFFSTVVMAVVIFIPIESTFALSSPNIIAERILHTRNHTTEAILLISNQPTYFEMFYCEGQTLPPLITSGQCTWIMDSEWQTGYHNKNIVFLNGLSPDTYYTYRIQLVNEYGVGVVTNGTFLNR